MTPWQKKSLAIAGIGCLALFLGIVIVSNANPDVNPAELWFGVGVLIAGLVVLGASLWSAASDNR